MDYVTEKILKTGEKNFTVKLLSSILGVHKTTITRYIRVGKLKGKKVFGAYVIKQSDIFKFLDLYNYYS